MRYETHKHTGYTSHLLDTFENFADAISSAQTLHNSDWDVGGQGIWVFDTKITTGSKIVFDTAS